MIFNRLLPWILFIMYAKRQQYSKKLFNLIFTIIFKNLQDLELFLKA